MSRESPSRCLTLAAVLRACGAAVAPQAANVQLAIQAGAELIKSAPVGVVVLDDAALDLAFMSQIGAAAFHSLTRRT